MKEINKSIKRSRSLSVKKCSYILDSSRLVDCVKYVFSVSGKFINSSRLDGGGGVSLN